MNKCTQTRNQDRWCTCGDGCDDLGAICAWVVGLMAVAAVALAVVRWVIK